MIEKIIKYFYFRWNSKYDEKREMTVDKMALEQRRNDIRDLIMVPGEKVNIDMLMDVLGNGSLIPIIM